MDELIKQLDLFHTATLRLIRATLNTQDPYSFSYLQGHLDGLFTAGVPLDIVAWSEKLRSGLAEADRLRILEAVNGRV